MKLQVHNHKYKILNWSYLLLQIQGNRSASDVLLYYTTTGWMMWNWMVSALALGTTLVLYDGSPLLPHPVSQPLSFLVRYAGYAT